MGQPRCSGLSETPPQPAQRTGTWWYAASSSDTSSVSLQSRTAGILVHRQRTALRASLERAHFILTVNNVNKQTVIVNLNDVVNSYHHTIILSTFLPKKEKKRMTELSRISKRRCVALPVSRVDPIFLFLRVACHREYLTVHHRPASRKKLPGRAWPLKLPMTPE